MSAEDAPKPQSCSNASCVLLGLVVCALLVVSTVVTLGTLSRNFDRRVHAGMTRAEIEAYLGPPEGVMASTDEIPPEDRSRYDLPDIPAPGGIADYRPRYEPVWLSRMPTAMPLGMTWVFVYYDEEGVATHVFVRNFG